MGGSSVSSVDQRVKTLSVVLEPALVLARLMGMSLDDLQRLVAVGYFREYRLRGLSIPQVARYLGKSERTVATLAQKSSEVGPLLDGSRRVQLQREVIRLGSLGVVSRAEAQRLQPPLAEEAVDAVLEQMVEGGLIAETEGGWVTVAEHIDMVSEELDARLDSLRHFLTAVAQVVHGRFFRPRAEAQSFARVWTFAASRESLARLQRESYERLRDAAGALDSEDTEDKRSASLVFALVESPDDIGWRPGRRR